MLSELETNAETNSLAQKKIILNYRNYFLTKDTTQEVIQYNTAQKYRGDFYGLMAELRIDKDLWFITMLLTNIRSPYDFDGEEFTLQKISLSEFDTVMTNSPDDIISDYYKELYEAQ